MDSKSPKLFVKKTGSLLILISLLFLTITLSGRIQAQGTSCATATAVTLSSCPGLSGTINDATIETVGTPAPSCASILREGWYKFTVSGGPMNINVTAVATNRNLVVQVLSGSCGTLTQVGCSNAMTTAGVQTESVSLASLANGTYYIRIGNTTANNMALASLVVSTPLSNDECSGATSLTVGTSCSFVTFGTCGATASAGIPAPGCAYYVGGDVWFSVVVPSTGHIRIDTKEGTLTDCGMAIYSGSCGSLTLIECDDDESDNGYMPMIDRCGLTPGSTIYIRFWDLDGNAAGTFQICASDPNTFDNCFFATSLSVGTSCSYTTYDNTGATPSFGLSTPGCSSSSYFYDVWFTVTVPASGNIRISTQSGSLTDCEMALYSGYCCSLTQIACNAGYSPGYENMPFIDLYGRTPGEVIYVRFWDYANIIGNLQQGTFGICTYDLTTQPSCVSNPAASDACSGVPLIANLNGYCGNTSSSYTPDQAAGLTSAGFCGTIENNSWLSFVASSATAQFNIYVDNCYSSSHSWSYSTSGIQMQIFSTSDCSTFTAYSSCWFPGIPTDGFVTATGLTPGNIYYLMIDGTYGDNCDYTIGASSGVLLPIELVSFNAFCHDGKVNISWSTSSETNNDYFTVEKSSDTQSFESIATIAGAGNSNSLLSYNTSDDEPFTNVSYYRLKQTDYDGISSYSPIVAVDCARQEYDVTIYPNPFNNYLSINLGNYEGGDTIITLLDITGREVPSVKISNTDNDIIMSFGNEVAEGYYFVKIQNKNECKYFQVYKVKSK